MDRSTAPKEIFGSIADLSEPQKERLDGKKKLLRIAVAFLHTAIAFIFCAKKLPFTSLSLGIPLADAFLCAATSYTPFVFAGNLLGILYFHTFSIQNLIAPLTVFSLRLLSLKKNAFKESYVTKLAIASVAALLQTALYTLKNGINGDVAKTALATLITLPILVLVLSIYFAKPSDGKTAKSLYEISLTLTFLAAVYCAEGLEFAFISLDTLIAVFCILCVARYGGFARATVLGILLGSTVSTVYTIPFTILGATASLFFSFGVFGACGTAVLSACVVSVVTGGSNALLTFVPEAVIATAISTPIIRYAFIPESFPYPSIAPVTAETQNSANKLLFAQTAAWKHLMKLSDGLTELSSEVCRLSEATDSDVFAEETANKLCQCICDSCPMSPVCLDTDFERTRESLMTTVKRLANGILPLTDAVPQFLSSRCIKITEITRLANEEARVNLGSKRRTGKKLMLSYPAATEMLSSVSRFYESELVSDREAELGFSRALYSAGVPFSSVSVIGNMRKKVYVFGSDRQKLKKAADTLIKSLGKLLPFTYLPPYFDDSADAPAVFCPAGKLCAEAALASSQKEGEKVSGDTAISFENGNGDFFALIADGMGSGATAQKSSAMTAEMIRTLALCGVSEKTAIRLADEAISSTCDECFSTADIIRLDLINGIGTVTKSHAADSFVLRNGSVYRCNASSMPIGSGADSEPKEMSFRVSDGDVIIMVSDGVTDSFDTSLTDYLGLSWQLPPSELANGILSLVKNSKGAKDDMTVLAIKLTAALKDKK